MRRVEIKNNCLFYYGNPVGYRTEHGVVADHMFRRQELEAWLAGQNLPVQWQKGVYDRLSACGTIADDRSPSLCACRIWQLGPAASAQMRFIGLEQMMQIHAGPDLGQYQVVFDGAVPTNDLDDLWEAFCREPLGCDGQPLAISDIIELYNDTGSTFYYVDRTAIVPIQPVTQQTEQDMTMAL